MTELQLGKYEFYPYPKELVEPPPTLEELFELLRDSKTKNEKDVKRPRDLLSDADRTANYMAKRRKIRRRE